MSARRRLSGPDRPRTRPRPRPISRRHDHRGAESGPLAFCDPPAASPATPNRRRPDVAFERKVDTSIDLTMPGGEKVRFWGFSDGTGKGTVPGPIIRVREGQLVHTTLHAAKNVHTIHHHGIEPDAFNDGVGHTSFEVKSRYTYQWRASTAGTYFYHCHVNTVLHLQMGMLGVLVVDPAAGPGRAYTGGPGYDVEKVWAIIDVDPTKHRLSHAAGVCGGDAGLNTYAPKYFLINGAAHPLTRTDPAAVIAARAGETVLLRLVCVSQSVLRVDFGALPAEVVASDGRPYPRPEAVRELPMVTAERYDCLIRPSVPGRYPITVEYRDFVTGRVVGIAESALVVT